MTPESLQGRQLAEWAEGQIQALISLDINPLEAQRSIQWLLDHLPPLADPNKWIPSAEQLADVEPTAPRGYPIVDARLAWYVSEAIPTKYKRLLDARSD